MQEKKVFQKQKKEKQAINVEAIQIVNKEITGLAIKNNKNKRVFVWKRGK